VKSVEDELKELKKEKMDGLFGKEDEEEEELEPAPDSDCMLLESVFTGLMGICANEEIEDIPGLEEMLKEEYRKDTLVTHSTHWGLDTHSLKRSHPTYKDAKDAMKGSLAGEEPFEVVIRYLQQTIDGYTFEIDSLKERIQELEEGQVGELGKAEATGYLSGAITKIKWLKEENEKLFKRGYQLKKDKAKLEDDNTKLKKKNKKLNKQVVALAAAGSDSE
jgi:hypothetical protein